MKADRFRADRIIPAAALALVGMGILMVYSNSAILADRSYGDPHFFLRKHLFFAAIGIGLMFLFSRIQYYALRKLAYVGLIGSAVFLGLLFVPGLGLKAGGATRWLNLVIFSFQPAELAKLAVVVYLAHSLTKKEGKMRSFRVGILPHVIVTAAIALLVLAQPDFGSAVAIGTLVFLILFVAGARTTYIAALAAALAPVLWHLVKNTEYRWERILAFLSPWDYATTIGYHAVQSFYSFASGGIFGRGPGDGMQKLFFLPEAHTDFILSAIGEELGFAGVLIIVLLFFVLITFGFRTAGRTADPFGAFLATGITLLIGLQAVINMAMVLGLVPTKGLTLPFISYGGTSLVVSLVSVGILTAIARQASTWGAAERGGS